MIGCQQVVISLFDEGIHLEAFMRKHYEFCVKNNLRRNSSHQHFDVSQFFSLLLNEITDPRLSITNQGNVLGSTSLLIREGVPETNAKQIGSQLARTVYKKLCMYFPDISFEELCTVQFDFINRYDVMFTFINQ